MQSHSIRPPALPRLDGASRLGNTGCAPQAVGESLSESGAVFALGPPSCPDAVTITGPPCVTRRSSRLSLLNGSRGVMTARHYRIFRDGNAWGARTRLRRPAREPVGLGATPREAYEKLIRHPEFIDWRERNHLAIPSFEQFEVEGLMVRDCGYAVLGAIAYNSAFQPVMALPSPSREPKDTPT